MRENAERGLGFDSDEILGHCMVISAVESIERALEHGLGDDQIVVSCKVSNPPDLITIYRSLAEKTDQPLHLGLTEAGIGVKGLVWSAAAMGVLLSEGIGDTIRMSLTPTRDGDRCQEVYAACELLQALGMRAFSPKVTACPGCGRTTSSVFQDLAARVECHVRENLVRWRERHAGVENLRLAIMGCVVNGPGESRHADVGISLPGTGEAPRCPVFVNGQPFTTLEGDADTITARFIEIIEDYIAARYSKGALDS
jgi:(E)-4-hydroxy-3-methylbut-2-enyl-diphosphate synthase